MMKTAFKSELKSKPFFISKSYSRLIDKEINLVNFRFYQKLFTEVVVQFHDEDPAWIPLETLLAMRRIYTKE